MIIIMESHRIKVIDRWTQEENNAHVQFIVEMFAPSEQDAVEYIKDVLNFKPEDKRYLVLTQDEEKEMQNEFLESIESASDIMDSFGGGTVGMFAGRSIP